MYGEVGHKYKFLEINKESLSKICSALDLSLKCQIKNNYKFNSPQYLRYRITYNTIFVSPRRHNYVRGKNIHRPKKI